MEKVRLVPSLRQRQRTLGSPSGAVPSPGRSILVALGLLLPLISVPRTEAQDYAAAGHGSPQPEVDCVAREGFPEPCRIDVASTEGQVPLFVQFAESESVSHHGRSRQIWTRSYGLKRDEAMIPGPSFFFHPGDFLQITLNNVLGTRGFNELELEAYEEDVDPTFDTDEILEHIGHEINIPHNPNNTNLHTHGLHVDPSEDDVTLVIIPEGERKTDYGPELWPFIREGLWPYQYRIPEIHLPGTHWYHAHKHGSTSVHVENGMAGALIIQPKDPARAVVPHLPPEHDRVLVVQEIANYGIQKGIGHGAGSSMRMNDKDVDSVGGSNPDASGSKQKRKDAPRITVNGVVEPTLPLRPGQVERWRFINAAANHHSFSYLWLGKKVHGAKKTFEMVDMDLVAIDGITLSQKIAVNAEKPLFMGPGNRADVVVRLGAGDYTLFKNFPDGIHVVDAGGDPVTPAATQDQIANPYLMTQVDSSQPNFDNFEQCWSVKKVPGVTGGPTMTSLAPLLRATPSATAGGDSLIDVDYETRFEVGASGWQALDPAEKLGGGTNTQALFDISVSGPPARGSLPTDEHLKKISPTGNPAAAPAYVKPIADGDVLQSRPAVFDISAVRVVVSEDGNPQQVIRQFTLNGRQFGLSDSIGNPDASRLVGKKPSLPQASALGVPREGKVDLSLDMTDISGLWSNTYWTNPSYNLAVEETSKTCDNGQAALRYPESAHGVPMTFQDVTGLATPSVVNAGYPGAGEVRGIPGEPVATTAEEWILINNSTVGHPFHIHINPFFITEVGQLSYEPFADGELGWVIRTINPNKDGVPADATQLPVPTGPTKLPGTSAFWWVVNNWWDTIVIPPHGYVKMRFWVNVPQQDWDGARIVDNVNRFGNWVYHCHILRHEDRGMMMMVGAQPKVTDGEK